MKTKHFLFFTLGMFLVTLIACTKDSDDFAMDLGSKTSTQSRDAGNLRISYDMETSQNIKPTKGSIKDLCALDIKMITVPSSTSTVTTSIGPGGETCMEFIDEVTSTGSKNPKEGRRNQTVTKYCDGLLTFTDENGTTTTITSKLDISMFESIYKSYSYTETQKDSVLNVMIQDAKNNGAEVTQNGNALTIKEIDADGNTVTLVYDIKNHVLVASSTVDKNGNPISNTKLGYKCTADGKIVPDYVISYNYKNDLICSEPVITVEQVNFNNFKVSL